MKRVIIRQKKENEEKMICQSCGQEIFFNVDIYEKTGMCGACTTGEARLNFEEDEDEDF